MLIGSERSREAQSFGKVIRRENKMSESTDNLTGVWQGLYSYPRALEPVLFVATLIETLSHVTGSTHEPHRITDRTLRAMLSGRRNGSRIDFVKTYEQTEGGYGEEIRYDGTICADASEIEGRWIIRADWSGRFLMIRGSRDAEQIARKKFARV
jgi:hypothetical protein